MSRIDSSRAALAALLCGWFLLLSGCGGGLQSSVTGTVTLDGKPVNRGNVTFIPVKDGVTAYGTIGSDGSYSINTGSNTGVVPGDYIVLVVVNGDIPPAVAGKAPEPPKPLSPPKYAIKETSDLKATIKSGSNVVPLNMVSK